MIDPDRILYIIEPAYFVNWMKNKIKGGYLAEAQCSQKNKNKGGIG